MPEMFHRMEVLVNDLKALGHLASEDQFEMLLPLGLEMLTLKIWHIGHYSREEWFGHYDTKPSVGRYNDRRYI